MLKLSLGSLFENIADESTSSPGVSPVRTLALRARVLGLTENEADCGGKCCGWRAKCDPTGYSLRTYLLCEAEDMTGYTMTWLRRVTPQGRSWWVLSMLGGGGHRRHRVWIVAYTKIGGFGTNGGTRINAGHAYQCGAGMANTKGIGCEPRPGECGNADGEGIIGKGDQLIGSNAIELADPHGCGSGENIMQAKLRAIGPIKPSINTRLRSDTDETIKVTQGGNRWPARPGEEQHDWEEPRLIKLPLGGTVDGLPVRLVRFANRNALKAYGNSVVPQIPEIIGRWIMKAGSV